jgi:hypothetical protein
MVNVKDCTAQLAIEANYEYVYRVMLIFRFQIQRLLVVLWILLEIVFDAGI